MREETVLDIMDSLHSEYSKNLSQSEKALKLRNWNKILEDVTDEQGIVGLEKALKSNREFMPTVGAFREMCLSGDGCQSLEDQSLHAWGLIEQNINAYISPVFKDPCIAEAIRQMGGWKNLCSGQREDLPFRKKEFCQLYPILKRHERDFNPILAGIYADVKFLGFESQEEIEDVKLRIEQSREAEKEVLGLLAKVNGNQ